MKILHVLVIVAAVFGYTSSKCIKQGVSARGIFDDIINSTFESVKAKLADPLTIDDLSLDLTNSLLHGGAKLTSFKLSGLQGLVATNIKVSVLKLRVDITLEAKEIILTTKYWTDMVLAMLVPLYGEGRASFTFDDISLQISAAANLTGGISLKDTEVVLALGDAVIDLHGLLNNEEFSVLVSAILNDNLVDFINNNQGVISQVISGLVESVINGILAGQSFKSYDEYLQELEYC